MYVCIRDDLRFAVVPPPKPLFCEVERTTLLLLFCDLVRLLPPKKACCHCFSSYCDTRLGYNDASQKKRNVQLVFINKACIAIL